MSKLFVITGPSGTGKGTVLASLLSQNKDLFLSISATTRQPRKGEIDGVHYYFLDRETFEAQILENNFLEYAEYAGNYYGTPKNKVVEKINQGFNVILEIETAGAMIVREKMPSAVLIFISPPCIEELKKRLIGRGTDMADIIAKRLEIAKNELTLIDKFDFGVLNDDVETAVEKIQEIIIGE